MMFKEAKKRILLVTVLGLFVFMVACNRGNDEVGLDTISGAEDNTGNMSDGTGDGYKLEVPEYARVLDKYYEALSEKWKGEELVAEDLSLLNLYCQEKNALLQVGFLLVDVDYDKVPELLIGSIDGDEFVDKMIFEMYTIKNGEVVKYFTGQERNYYYITQEETGDYIFCNHASGGAGQTARYMFNILNREINVVQAIIYDNSIDAKNPWYMTYDTDGDVRNDDSIDEELACDIMDSYEKRYLQLQFIPFAQYK